MAPAATHTSVPRAGLTCSPNPSPTWKTTYQRKSKQRPHSLRAPFRRWAAILAIVAAMSANIGACVAEVKYLRSYSQPPQGIEL